MREIWYEEAHAACYLVALPAQLAAPPGSTSGWREQVVFDGVAKRALALQPGDRLRYRLLIPPRGVLHIWLALPAGGDQAELAVVATAADGKRCEWTRRIAAPRSGWTRWTVPLAALAEAEVDLELTTRRASGAAPLWGNPVILSRRGAREIAALARAFVALFGPRDALRKAWELARRPTFDRGDDYETWRRRRRSSLVVAPSTAPRISLLLRCHGASDAQLALTLESIRGQTHADWQVCVALPAERAAALTAAPGVTVDSAGEDTWERLLALADGELVATIDAGDALAAHALAAIAAAAQSDIDVVYSDEDQVDADGRHHQPFFKPDWSPEYFLASGYTGRLTAWRRRAVEAVGGFRPELGSAQEFDLTLRLIERGAAVRHVDDVLYHRRGAPHAWNGTGADAVRAVDEHFARCAVVARGEPHAHPGLLRIRYALRQRPLVSIVMPTGGRERLVGERRLDLLLNCVQTIVRHSSYENVEILCIDDANLRPETRAGLAALNDPRIRLHTDDRLPLNIAAKMNYGARLARGEHLLFLNDDIEVVTPDWIEALLEYSQQPAVGAVGPKLLFPSGVVQHAGMAVADSVPIILFRWAPRDAPGYFGNLAVPCNYSALIGACLMTRRELFERFGGFDEAMPFIWHDLDYCFMARAAGLRVVFTPYAELYHFETASRPSAFRSADTVRMARKWGQALRRDPYYSRHFRQDRADFRVGG